MDKNKMLIDATHPEETRVVALRNGRVEEFDFESAARKLLRGNIYLAKVTRVEPSLQAAFIDYGGNRHGFLAFNEIHPDYYQIPVADREALKQEEAEAEQRAEEEADEPARARGSRRRRRGRGDRNGGDGHRSANGSRDDSGRDDGGRDDGSRDDPSSEIETFEDGYRTSGPTVRDSDGDEPAPTTIASLAHDSDRDDVRRSEPVVDLPAPVADLVPATGAIPSSEAFGGPEAIGYDVPSRHSEGEATLPAGERDAGHDDRRDHRHEHSDDHDQDHDHEARGNGDAAADDEHVEQIATEDDALEEVPERPRRRARQYKIQEVIKRRQIMLVQVVKEERGNKGAALTTYISLAGRYTVLMPNTARGGGISRKITQPQDRKRLKSIAEELDVEEGMGLIIRTAGAARTKQEIKRDYDYLMRLWENVRELTLSSTAPCLVYEEGNIIKRAIRDLYSKEFDQIVVAGDAAHREAQDFMEMLMPGAGSHVASYRAPEPLFARFGIERQLNALFSPYVTLRSGGYIVINQTEALVSVDVNSGKSTREFSIEETALNTNLEAAEEIARQLKLRDLAGLIVIDFIDMEEKRNNRNVERRLKDALRFDRARIQVGRISHFGLLEMSRQRLRAGVLEGSTSQCPHCQGTGIIRSIESVALAVLRGLEDQLLKQPSSLAAITTAEVALYILNHKRGFIVDMERRHGVAIRVESSDRMQGANFAVERIAAPVVPVRSAQSRAAVSMEWGFDRDDDAAGDDASEAVVAEPLAEEEVAPGDDRAPRAEGGGDDERRGKRRRRRRGRRDGPGDGRPASEDRGPQAGFAADNDERGSEREAGRGSGRPSGPDDGDDDMEVVSVGGRGPEASRSDDLPDADMNVADGGDDDGDGAGDGERSNGASNADGEGRRRGRRRGRRGGRSRRREGGEGTGVSVEGQTSQGHAWGIAEVARPGAEQPSSSIGGAAFGGGRSVGLVGSVEGGSYERSLEAPRASHILEPIGGVDGGRSPSDEAVRLALSLASDGRLPKPEPAPVVIQAPPPAPIREMRPPVAAVERSVATPGPVTEIKAPIAAPIPAWPRMQIQSGTPQTVAPQALATPVSAIQATAPDAAHANGSGSGSAGGSDAHGAAMTVEAAEPAVPSGPPPPSRKGWWQRRFGSAE